MKARIKRRFSSLTFVLLIAGCLKIFNDVLLAAHHRTSTFSGWCMFAMILFLAAYSFRKKFSFLPARYFPIGTAANWLHFHIYIGLLTSVVFLIHVNFRIPNGMMECALTTLYLVTFISGVFGLGISRMIPRRLNARGEEVIFERIPVFRKEIHDEIVSLSSFDAEAENSSALPELYFNHLRSFFSGPRNIVGHLFFSERHRYRLLQVVTGCRPYLSQEEEPKLERIVQLVKTKDDLDFHYTHQGMLKLWLFVHIPFTYSLIVFAIFHILTVYSFS